MNPVRLITATVLALSGTATPLTAQDTFLIDFGGGGNQTFMGPFPDDPDNFWNNLEGGIGQSDTGVLFDLQTTAGDVITDMNIEMVRRFNGVNNSGTNASFLYPESATIDNLFGNTEDFSGLSDIFPAFKFTGLDPTLAYTFTFYASRLGVGDVRETGYTVTGTNVGFAALNASNNDVDETATVALIPPDENNEILIEIAPTAANNNGNHFTYLGVLKIETGMATEDVTITSQPSDRFVTEFLPVTFSVSASGSGELTYQWYLDGGAIDGATGFTYTIDEALLDMDGNEFTVTVSNGTSMATSDPATLTVDPDFDFPVLQYTYSPDGSSAAVYFSEPVVEPGATDLANYSATADGNPVGITSATLDPTGTVVTLGLATTVVGEFVLVANNVEDRAGNTIDPDTTRTGQGPGRTPTDILIDFGGAATVMGDYPNDPLNAWNTVTNAIGTNDFGLLDGIVTVNGDVTAIGLEMIRRFNGTNTNGDPYSGLYPASASGDSLYGNTELWGDLVDIFPAFKLFGLDPAKAYDLYLYSARLGPGDNRETGYTVTGAGDSFIAFNPVGNVTGDAALLEALAPSTAGEITIEIAPTDNNDNANHFTYLGVLEIREASTDPPVITGPFVVTSITLDELAGDLTLVWTSEAGATYTIEEFNPSTSAWGELIASITGLAGTTSQTITGVDPSAAPQYRLFRVVRVP